MKVWVYVEGKSEEKGLSALLSKWRQELKNNGWGIRIIPLDNKDKYFRKIGARATEKLVNNSQDIVVGLPDLYPNSDYANTEFKHRSLKELCDVQTRIVKQNLEKCVSRPEIDDHISRFFPSALKHDLEVLLLAATPQLQFRIWKNAPQDAESSPRLAVAAGRTEPREAPEEDC